MKEKPPVPTFFEEKPPPPRGGGGGGGQQQEQQNREVRESGPEEEEMMPPLPVYVAPEWSGPPEGQTSFSLEVLKSGQVVDLIVLTTTTTTTSKVDDDDVVPKSRSYVTFGRHPLCDVVIEHPSSSRLHCVLQFKKNTKEMYLFDPGSTHGVFVNKRKLKKGIHAPIFVGDQIKFGESTRDYIVQGDEALMPECGLTNRELEKVKEIQKRREMEQRKDEEEKKMEEAAVAWGMASEEFEKKNMDEDDIDWRTHDVAKFTQNMRKAIEKVRQKEMKAENMRSEIERIKRKESSQEGGLMHGQVQQMHKNETALELLQEHIDEADERLNESLREVLGLASRNKTKEKRKKRKAIDSEDEEEDGFYDRTEKRASKKEEEKNNKKKKKNAKAKIFVETETAASLWEKKLNAESTLKSLQTSLEKARKDQESARIERERLDATEDADAMDIFTSDARKEACADTIQRLLKSIDEKEEELERHASLLEIADPHEEFKPGTSKGDALKAVVEKEKKEKEEAERKRKQELIEKMKAEKEKQMKEHEERLKVQKWEKEGQLLEKKTFTGGADGIGGANGGSGQDNAKAEKKRKIIERVEDEAPVVVDEEEKTRKKETSVKSLSPPPPSPATIVSEPKRDAIKLDDPGDGFLTPAQVKALADKQGGFGLQIRKKPTVAKNPSSNPRTTTTTTSHLGNVKTDEQIRSEAERKVELEMRKILSGGFGQDERDEDKEVNAKEKEEDDNWVAPIDQRGDGKTRLNEKLGY
jgi:pSer/pThr/pTyr-binding forkhead associated (FHA) protein